MAYSDEEGEIFPNSVTDYEFIDQKDEHISFAFLPFLWNKDESIDSVNLQMYLSGVSSDGLEKIYKQVIAWRYELSYVQPEISVLCKGNHWVKLLKPKKKFQAVVRSILITIHCLHFVKHNPEATKTTLWHQLTKVFSMYEIAPSETDCMSHILLIRKAAELDKTLMNSEYIFDILLEKSANGKVLQTDGLPVKRDEFIADDALDDPCELDDFVDNDEEFFDTCCSFCDNGGDILSCEGRCMRSFHATVESGEGSCESLGLSAAQVNAMPSFNCKNCQYQQHQCFICGILGSSDISSNPEVFPCIAANCGRFYHPKCVSRELRRRNEPLWEDIKKKIAAGETFVCPAHKCFVCKQVEDREVKDLQFAVCRRCPKSYHRKCLPREIPFENDDENGILQRAWDGLLQKRILIFCLDHEIDPELGTPLRDHIIFPGTSKGREHVFEKHCNSRADFPPKKRKLTLYSSATETEKTVERANSFQTERKTAERANNLHHSIKRNDPTRSVWKGSTNSSCDVRTNARCGNVTPICRSGNVKVLTKPHALGALTTNKTAVKMSTIYSEKSLSSNVLQPGNSDRSLKKFSGVHSAKPPIEKKRCANPVVNIEVERRITALMEKVNSSFDVEEFKKKQVVPSNYKTQNALDKTLTKGRVEATVKAARTALQKIVNGGSIDDAKAVCSVGMLRQIPIWKKKLDVYLAPFLHGMTYSSYGRHFTKPDKLQEIVERLHWYVRDGDMIVDFCCGANDFSCLMKKRLESVGKKCNYKNYDLFPSKNDFNFERRDWFSVNPKELAEGSRLIMGLNPPFGYKAALANQFISKALQFRPKLLILIVPPITQRLDSRGYDLIWEDPHLLAGESFYLPGSCDADEKQLSQWNKITPPLYLWSRRDWTLTHRTIANKCGQFKLSGEPSSQMPTWNYLYEEQHDCYGDYTNMMNVYGNLPAILDDVPEHIDNLELYQKFNENFNGAVFSNPCNIPREIPVAGKPETDVHFSPVEDMDISPVHY